MTLERKLALAGILILVVGLIASIGLHELGHMIPAKKFKVEVPQYMIGFGPRLWSRKIGETEYGLRLIPLGGYVRILGMLPPAPEGRKSSRMVAQARLDSASELDDDQRAFWRLKPWKKLIVMSGGPLMNLGIWLGLSFIILSVIGLPAPTNVMASLPTCIPKTAGPVPKGSTPPTQEGCVGATAPPAITAGLKEGDRIVKVGAVNTGSWNEAYTTIQALTPGKSTKLTVERNNETLTLTVTPVPSPYFEGASYIGVASKTGLIPVPVTEAPAMLKDQLEQTIAAVAGFPVKLVSAMVSTVSGAERDPTGPVSIVGVGRLGGEVSGSENLSESLKLVTLLSLIAGVNLALFIFNMLPFLPLDGGHIISAAWESIRKRLARLRGRPDPGPVDVARLLPMSYAVTVFLIVMSVGIMVADIVNPIRILG